LKAVSPDLMVFVIGPADMSVRIEGNLQTHEQLENVRNALKKATLDAGGIFWDMYEAMGGNGSMIQWVNRKPALGSPDYIHFTQRGACRRNRRESPRTRAHRSRSTAPASHGNEPVSRDGGGGPRGCALDGDDRLARMSAGPSRLRVPVRGELRSLRGPRTRRDGSALAAIATLLGAARQSSRRSS
jgi:hypothetical protein